MTLTAHLYPFADGQHEIVPWTETIEIWEGEDVIDGDADVRDHPEVPLTIEQRDAVLARLGYQRIGVWVEGESGSADVDVRPL